MKWFLLAYLKLGAFFFFHPIQSLRCGTTGVVTFIRGNMLHVAWLGDSQVMLVRRGQAVELMKPHKPDREVRTACFKYTRAVFTAEADRYQLYVGCWDTACCLANVSWSGSVGSSYPILSGSRYGFVCKSSVLIWWGLQPPPHRDCENTKYLLKCSECDGSTKRSVQTTPVLPCCLG